jgi:hypothetical protein
MHETLRFRARRFGWTVPRVEALIHLPLTEDGTTSRQSRRRRYASHLGDGGPVSRLVQYLRIDDASIVPENRQDSV